MPRLLMHVHTEQSYDASITFEALEKFTREHQIDYLVVTEHNHMASYPLLFHYFQEKKNQTYLIPAEEIATQVGEVIGLFMKEEIPAGKSLYETVAHLKSQDALIYIPHPFDKYRSERIRKPEYLYDILDDVHIIESFNSRNISIESNRQAYAFAMNHGKYVCGGADAHFVGELKNCILDIPEFDVRDPKTFLSSLEQMKYITKKRTYLGMIRSGLRKRMMKHIPAYRKRVQKQIHSQREK